MRHARHGRSCDVLRAVLVHLDRAGLIVEAVAPLLTSVPIGPSSRRYANGAVLVRSEREPEDVLACLKAIEARFGRRPGGIAWRSRVLDLDIVLWSGGVFASPVLTIPHIHFRQRAFVLLPARAIAPSWRDPLTGCTIRQLAFRLQYPKRRLEPHRSRSASLSKPRGMH